MRRPADQLLDEVGLISGVSGGSILAAYYAAFGDEVFTRFEHDFLLANFQSGLIRDLLFPRRCTSSARPGTAAATPSRSIWTPCFAARPSATCGRSGPRPRLLVTATDLTTGAPFEFTPEQFALICSDLDSVPLSFAVAASSAVPLLLSPVTLRNFAGSLPAIAQPRDDEQPDRNLSARLLHLIADSYRNARNGRTSTWSTAASSTTSACAACWTAPSPADRSTRPLERCRRAPCTRSCSSA